VGWAAALLELGAGPLVGMDSAGSREEGGASLELVGAVCSRGGGGREGGGGDKAVVRGLARGRE